MSVKTIFKVLIGTIVIILVSTIVLEIYNTMTVSVQLNQIMKLACRQACETFSKETYKYGRNELSNIYDCDNQLFISGDIYGNKSAKDIYKSLYGGNEFKDWVQTKIRIGDSNTYYWDSLRLLVKGIHNDMTGLTENEKVLAETYSNMMLTPSNLGVPYLDKDIVTKLYKWGLTKILSNCDPDLIKANSRGNRYVDYKGFRVYTSDAKVSNLDYEIFDISKDNDKKRLYSLTSINADNIDISTEANSKYICVVGVEYTVELEYKGITPLSNILRYILKIDIEGENRKSLTSGGFSGNNTTGTLPLPGKLVYYIIK